MFSLRTRILVSSALTVGVVLASACVVLPEFGRGAGAPDAAAGDGGWRSDSSSALDDAKGPTPDAGMPLRFFITHSTEFRGDFALQADAGAAEAAARHCQNAAKDAALGGTWVAYLWTGNTEGPTFKVPPSLLQAGTSFSRVEPGGKAGPEVLRLTLEDASRTAKDIFDEKGTATDFLAWVGDSDTHCNGWRWNDAEAPIPQVALGSPRFNFTSAQPESCGASHALFCIEIAH